MPYIKIEGEQDYYKSDSNTINQTLSSPPQSKVTSIRSDSKLEGKIGSLERRRSSSSGEQIASRKTSVVEPRSPKLNIVHEVTEQSSQVGISMMTKIPDEEEEKGLHNDTRIHHSSQKITELSYVRAGSMERRTEIKQREATDQILEAEQSEHPDLGDHMKYLL